MTEFGNLGTIRYNDDGSAYIELSEEGRARIMKALSTDPYAKEEDYL